MSASLRPLIAVGLTILSGCGRDTVSEAEKTTVTRQNEESADASGSKAKNVLPFGIADARTLQELGAEKKANFKDMWFVNPPTPHSQFRYYQVIFREGAGVCGIQAASQPKFLEQIDQKFRDTLRALADGLAKKYGEPIVEDRCLVDENICQRTVDSYNLNNSQRILKYSWIFSNRRDSGLNGIVLQSFGVPNSDDIFYALRYDYGYRTGCAFPFESNDEGSL